MALCHPKIGATATWSSKLSLNSLNLICEMNDCSYTDYHFTLY